MVRRQRIRHHASARVITIAALAAGGWLAMSAVATPSFAANGNGQGLATAPGQLSKLGSVAATTTAATTTAATTTAATTMAATTTAAVTTAPTTTAATVGDPTQPQPLSTADLNPGGANNGGNCGAYCSTRDGSASRNGSGTGKATGEPCAGCVGKADNKNPLGQQPDGTDHNKGYECDGNNGIGKTNPAHTGCRGTPPGTCAVNCGGGCTVSCGGGGTCVTPATCGGGNCAITSTCQGTPPGCVPSAANACAPTPPGSSCVATAANNFCSTVLGVQHQRRTTSTPPTVVLGEKLTRTPPNVSVLPFTGAPVVGMLGLAMSLLLLGAGAIHLGRPRIGTVAAPA